MLEQILNNSSLKIIEKILLSGTMKLKRKEKSLALSCRNYPINFKDCEKAYNQILDAMDFYGINSNYRNI